MKEIVSISLGSSKRDHSVEISLLGETLKVSRIGTDGDLQRALELYRELDGKVDALGVGGFELFFDVGGRKYYLKDGLKILNIVKKSKLADGNGVRPTLTRKAINAMKAAGIQLEGKKALITSSVDRFCEALAFSEAGCKTIFGDFIFAFGLDIPLHKIRTVKILAAILLPFITKLPFHLLYPIGAEQEKPPSKKHAKYYEWADIIVGDFLFIRKYLLDDMSGKIIFTNTTTRQDVEDLWRRGLDMLVTTTPEFNGRTFGTNVIEAIVLSMIDKPQNEITERDIEQMVEKLNIGPQVLVNPRKQQR